MAEAPLMPSGCTGHSLGGVWTSEPCRKLSEEPFRPTNGHKRVDMHAFFLPMPTQIPPSLSRYRVKRKPRPRHTRGDSTITQQILSEHRLNPLEPWDFKKFVICGIFPRESCSLTVEASICCFSVTESCLTLQLHEL